MTADACDAAEARALGLTTKDKDTRTMTHDDRLTLDRLADQVEVTRTAEALAKQRAASAARQHQASTDRTRQAEADLIAAQLIFHNPEPTGQGAVIAFTLTSISRASIHSVLMRSGDRWYSTGNDQPEGYTWVELLKARGSAWQASPIVLLRRHY